MLPGLRGLIQLPQGANPREGRRPQGLRTPGAEERGQRRHVSGLGDSDMGSAKRRVPSQESPMESFSGSERDWRER